MAKIIAFCGVDGSGKSTMINLLEEDGFIERTKYIRKNISDNVNLIRKYHHKHFNDSRDWIHGSYAQSVSFAGCLDFLHHYEAEIEDHIDAFDYLICDRYFQCFESFYYGTGGSRDLSDFFKKIKPPDYIVFIDAPLDVLNGRYEKRGGASEDESVEVMKVFRQAYLDLFEKNDIPIFTIMNDQTLEEAYRKVKKTLQEEILVGDVSKKISALDK